MPPPQATLSTKIKVQLKLSIARLKLFQQRDTALAKTSRRTMAQLLEQGKTDSARIRVESIIRSDITTELYELLELYCELLLARAGLLDAGGSVCDPGLEEAVRSIVYAAPKTEVKELQTLRALLAEKFGKEFVAGAMEGVQGGVSERVVRKLEVRPPREELVRGYLEEIARTYGVEWPRGKAAADSVPAEVEELDLLDMDDGDDGAEDGGGGGGGSALKELEELEPERPEKAKADAAVAARDAKETPAGRKKISPAPVQAAKAKNSAGSESPSARKPPAIPPPAAARASPKGTEMKAMKKPEEPKKEEPPDNGIPGLSELERRFAALKKLG